MTARVKKFSLQIDSLSERQNLAAQREELDATYIEGGGPFSGGIVRNFSELKGRRGPRPRSQLEEIQRTMLVVGVFFKYRKSGNQFRKSLELASDELTMDYGLPLSTDSVKAVIDALPGEEHIAQLAKDARELNAMLSDYRKTGKRKRVRHNQ